MPKTPLFKKSTLRKGYSVAVRDDLEEGKIIRRHIEDEHKQLYVDEFGHDMISDAEFFKWWCKINNYKAEDAAYPISIEDAKNVISK